LRKLLAVLAAVQAAGNDGAVDQHAELVAQSIAEHRVGRVGALDVRPCKFFCHLKIDPPAQLDACLVFQQLLRVLLKAEKAAYLLEDVHIALVFCLEYGAVFVPQAQHTVGAVQVTGCAAEFQRFAQVFLQRLTGPIGFKAVQRDADPIQGRALQQLLLPAVQQGAVGGQRHL